MASSGDECGLLKLKMAWFRSKLLPLFRMDQELRGLMSRAPHVIPREGIKCRSEWLVLLYNSV
jgi:hypothetical protein